MNYWDQFWAVWGGINLLVPATFILGLLSLSVPVLLVIVGAHFILESSNVYYGRDLRLLFTGIGLLLLAPVVLVFGIPLTNMVGLASGAF